MKSVSSHRRQFLALLAASSAATLLPTGPAHAYPSFPPLRGRLRQGLTPHLFNADLEDTCRMAVALGIKGLDFVSNPADWPLLKKHGLTMTMLRVDHGGGLSRLGRAPAGPPGWNAIGTPDQGGVFEAALRDRIDAAAMHGIPNIILTCGERGAIGHEEGKRNALAFLRRVSAHAEQRGVTLAIENINSGHSGGPPVSPGSMFDHLSWGLDVVSKVNSRSVKLLVDLYHAQLMDGNITNFLRANMQWIGHFHTGGVPGRNEIDETQELNYRHVARVIAEQGFTGFVSHEWMPSASADKLTVLRKSIEIIDV
ncbi:TIM barrel protein [Pseudoduganella lutea]|uniref:Hydroxypyruvate isomerase n=1 Tax=Pseudoduganella lutea TaxID=321985 RepID=A0A4P6L4N1_9BURK|nr:TIM barrel protein [Pseudoduganella lutea]QBE65848.1 hydroxypyruvate isomerase [Pseudoduganella lutea]